MWNPKRLLSQTLRADWWSPEAGENRREGQGEGVGQALTYSHRGGRRLGVLCTVGDYRWEECSCACQKLRARREMTFSRGNDGYREKPA